jgi:ribosomal protein L7Ae-like RNA K-turn-binding protein
MKYFLFLFFVIIFVVLSVVYVRVSEVELPNKTTHILKKEAKTEQKNILVLLSKNIDIKTFPAQELYMKIDLNKIPVIKILYRVVFEKLNKYQFFGVRQILELNNIKYSFVKSKNDLKLFINFDKKSQAVKIKRFFKDYNLNVRLKRIQIKGLK